MSKTHGQMIRRLLPIIIWTFLTIAARAQSDILLSSGVAYNGGRILGLVAGGGQEDFYRIVVPTGQTRLTVETLGGEGDVDVYVRRGARPTTTLFDAKSDGATTIERAVINNPVADTYFIMLKGYGSGYFGVSVRATYEGGSGSTPTWKWAKSTEGNDSSIDRRSVSGAALDRSGNVYVTGQFNNTAQFGGFRLVASAVSFPGIATSQAGFLAKYDSNGQVIWAVTNVGVASNAVAVGPDNSVYATGQFSGSVRFSSTVTLTTRQQENMFVAKYNATTGALIWALAVSGTGASSGLAIAVSGNTGKVYAGGYQVAPTSRVPSGTRTAHWVMIEQDGSVLFPNSLNGTDTSYISGIALDASDNLFLTGAFKASITTLYKDRNGRDVVLNSARTQNDVPTTDGFVFKLSSIAEWGQSIAGNSTEDAGNSVTSDGNGGAFVAGSIGNGHFLARFDSAGTKTWQLASASAAGSDYATTVASDGRGGTYWAGTFQGIFSIGTASLNSGSSAGSADIGGYVFNVAQNGGVQWAVQMASTIGAVTANVNGNIYVGGQYLGFLRLGSLSLSTGNSNTREAFTARLDTTIPPGISRQPVASSVSTGQTLTLTVEASGTGPFTYQWRKNGTNIAGATAASLNLTNLQESDNGARYDVIVTSSLGSVTSSSVTLTVTSAPAPSLAGRIINLSILTRIDAPGDSFTMGYVVGGTASGTKPLVIRAAGPSLAALGVGGTLDDPKMEFFAGSTKTGENDNWGGSSGVATAMAAVGAFAYSSPSSRDAAAAANVPRGDNSVRVSAVGAGAGAVIAEIYDATPAAEFTVNSLRLVNVSVLKHIGTGLTVGFVIGGATSRNILVRAIGPTIGAAPFNVAGVVADPQISLFRGQTKIGENNDWGGTPSLSSAFSQVGAFALPSTSKDAALLVSLEPGAYSMQVSGTNGTGVAVVEVYEVP